MCATSPVINRLFCVLCTEPGGYPQQGYPPAQPGYEQQQYPPPGYAAGPGQFQQVNDWVVGFARPIPNQQTACQCGVTAVSVRDCRHLRHNTPSLSLQLVAVAGSFKAGEQRIWVLSMQPNNC